MSQSKGFFGGLFDLSFSEFITPKVLKVLFVIGIIAAGIGTLIFVIGGFAQEWYIGLIFLVLSPIIFFLYVILIRIYMEVLIVIFRIAENVQALANKHQ